MKEKKEGKSNKGEKERERQRKRERERAQRLWVESNNWLGMLRAAP